MLATYAFPSESRLRLLEKLVALFPISNSKAVLYSSGTEATKCALMAMRRRPWAAGQKEQKKPAEKGEFPLSQARGSWP